MVAGCRAAKREAQMSVRSEHEFEGRVSGELSGEIFERRHIRSQVKLDVVTRSTKNDLASTCTSTESNIFLFIYI